MELFIPRTIFTKDASAGTLGIRSGNFSRIVYTLEDARRFPGIKIYGETCIPAGRYSVGIRTSNKFGREVPVIYNCDDEVTLKEEGIEYDYCYFHGLNDTSQTLGCIGVAYRRIGDDRIQDSAEKEVTKLIKDCIIKGEPVWLQITDMV